ncbi:hypothetical protein MMON44395_19880 [Mycolicibacterium monacense DSM 44395]|nr:hypothetical protein [Mycolicibacterium monacense DSM 44395]
MGFWPRVAAVLVLTVVSYFFVFAADFSRTVAGSHTAYLLVVPVLAVVIAAGYQIAPRGVRDTESDWIIAALVGVFGLTAIHMTFNRVPTFAGLLHLESIGMVIWSFCCAVMMFGARHVGRMWVLWLFALCSETPVPYLFIVAKLGGSDTAAALLAAVMGAVAVFLSGRTMRWRLLAAASCLTAAVTTVIVLDGYASLLSTVLIAAGVVPVLATTAKYRLSPIPEAAYSGRPTLPRRSPLTLAVLVVAAVGLLVLHPPAAASPAPPLVGKADWVERAGLGSATSFPFITRWLGAGATLTRFDVPAVDGAPQAVVDIITSPNYGALQDFSDMVWYPSDRPANYERPAAGSALPATARTVHSNADAATTDSSQDWYALSWIWRTPAGYQQVTVVVNQSATSPTRPPAPQPPSLADTIIKPALWAARVQPETVGDVDAPVVERADEVVRRVLAAAGATG